MTSISEALTFDQLNVHFSLLITILILPYYTSLNVELYFYTAMERSPDEIIQFLDKLKESHLKYCNVKSLSYRLEREQVINAAQKQQLEKCQSNAEANKLFHQFLCEDPAPETLKGAAEALKNAPETTNMNKSCAKATEEFLGIDPARLLELEGVCIHSVIKCEIIYRDYEKLNLVVYSFFIYF